MKLIFRSACSKFLTPFGEYYLSFLIYVFKTRGVREGPRMAFFFCVPFEREKGGRGIDNRPIFELAS